MPIRSSSKATTSGRAGGTPIFKWNINRFNGDLFDGALDRHPAGICRDQLHGLDGPELLPRRHGIGQGDADRHSISAASYTFGKATDFSSTFSPPQRPDAYGPPDQDKGRADFDVPHKVSLWATWMIPGPGSGIAKALLSGWQASGVMIAQSGTPFTVICEGRAFSPIRDSNGRIVGNSGCDYNADGAGNDRPNVPAFGSSLSGLSNDDFLSGIFTAADFPTPAPGVQGTLGRNTFSGPQVLQRRLLDRAHDQDPGCSGPEQPGAGASRDLQPLQHDQPRSAAAES